MLLKSFPHGKLSRCEAKVLAAGLYVTDVQLEYSLNAIFIKCNASKNHTVCICRITTVT